MSAEQTRGVIEKELGGAKLEDVFEWIDLEKPLGSASLAQVRTHSSTNQVLENAPSAARIPDQPEWLMSRPISQVHKARLRLHRPPPRHWWQRNSIQKQADFYSALPPAAVAATQARLAEGSARDGTVAVKVWQHSISSIQYVVCRQALN